MLHHVQGSRDGPRPGLTQLLALDDPRGVGIELAILRLPASRALTIGPLDHQAAVVLLGGSGDLGLARRRLRVTRRDVFRDASHTVLLPAGATIDVEAGDGGLELALAGVAGPGAEAPLVVPPRAVRIEERGQGQLGGTYHRQVHTIADGSNAREWGLVLGEVRSRPGRWSSYPPHHHPQPEIYYYRFDRPEGYGHAEVGERVVRVRDHDVTLMRAGEDHAQVCAPGYRMYYLWVIRNLPGAPYGVPEFTPEHQWLLSARRLPRGPRRTDHIGR